MATQFFESNVNPNLATSLPATASSLCMICGWPIENYVIRESEPVDFRFSNGTLKFKAEQFKNVIYNHAEEKSWHKTFLLDLLSPSLAGTDNE